MAYAEKRGAYWRVRDKRPDGCWDSDSGFETKESALNWGRDQETDIRHVPALAAAPARRAARTPPQARGRYQLPNIAHQAREPLSLTGRKSL
jgi:hypothetical protein